MTESEIRSSRRRALVLALATSALLLLAQEPVGASFLAFVALTPFCFLLDLPREARAGRALYVAGVLHFLIGCCWLRETNPANLFLMAFPEALAFPLALWLASRLRRAKIPTILSVPLAWVALEWLRSNWPFNGFPWLLLGNALATPLEFAQFAEWGGVLALSFAAALCAATLAAAWRLRTMKPVAFAVGIAALHLPGLLYAYGAKRIVEVRAMLEEGPKIVAIQANIPQELKRSGVGPDGIAEAHVRGTRDALSTEAADLVIWPETMVPGYVHARSDVAIEKLPIAMAYATRLIDDVATRLLAPRAARGLFGVLMVDGTRVLEDPTTNSALYVSPRGERLGVYSKTVLVPGGEFVPLRSVLGFVIDPIVRSIAGIIPALAAGDGPQVFTLPTFDGREFRFGVTICYENVYADYGVRVARGVDFVVNLSNEAWFKESFEFDQMDAASRLRAIESRRSLVRATNSGISALYSPTGERLATVTDPSGKDRAVEGVLRATPPICSIETPFVRWGARVVDVLAALVLICGFLLETAARYRARKAG